MKKKDLLAIKYFSATPEMIRTAKENPIEKKIVRTSWGNMWTEKTCKYDHYLRAAVSGDILKVAVFNQEDLQEGKTAPQFEVYCDRDAEKWTTWEPAKGKWRTARINNLGYSSFIYSAAHWQKDAERKMVNDYFSTGQNKDIFEAVLNFQNSIAKENLGKKYRNEFEQIDAVMREVPDIPKNFENWIAKNCFRETMFYEPDSMCHGRWPRMYCTHCRKWMDMPTKWEDRPEHNKEITCPSCKAKATYKSWNKQKRVLDEADVGLLQRLKDGSGYILRNFDCKISREHEKGWEDYELTITETERAKLDDHFSQMEYFEYGQYKNTGVIRWCHNCNRDGFYTYYGYYIGRVVMYTPNLKRELKNEPFVHMDLKKILKGGQREYVSVDRILSKLKRYPYLEYLEKSGLYTLRDEIATDREDRSLFNHEGTRIHEALKLDKQHLQRLKEWNGGCTILRAFQLEMERPWNWTHENLVVINQYKIDTDELTRLTERTGMNEQRTLNYLRTQMAKNGQVFYETRRYYTDYLDMAEARGMNVEDEIVCRQSEMMEYHNRYLEEKNRKKYKQRDMEVNRKYPDIRKNAKKYEERFAFQTDELEIVVPQRASDITREGRLQHHCVGASDAYIHNMNVERYFILFLRHRSERETPYYTLEVTWDGDIKQFYAAYDRQPDKEKIQKVLSEFTKTVKKREKEMEKKMHEMEKRDGTRATRIGTQWCMDFAQEVV